MNILTLREEPFYHVYRDADPALYEILMDTLHTMWVMREAARAEGKFIYDSNFAFDFTVQKELLYDIDKETNIHLRYIGGVDFRIERFSFQYSRDYEEIFRRISIYNRQNIYTFEQACYLVEQEIMPVWNISSKISHKISLCSPPWVYT